MPRERGASTLFLMALAALAIVVVAWVAWPKFLAMRNEQRESQAARGPTSSPPPARQATDPRERAEAAEFAEKHGGIAGIVDTDHYRALSATCRAIVDAYVRESKRTTASAAEAATVRAAVGDIEARFAASCVDPPAVVPAPAPAPVAEPARPDTFKDRIRANEKYRALSPECQGYMDALGDMVDKPLNEAVTQAEKDRAAELSRNYEARCVDREAEAKARAESVAREAAEVKNFACNDKRERADTYRRNIALGERYVPPARGGVDVDGRTAYESLDENRRQLQAVDADIAANCR